MQFSPINITKLNKNDILFKCTCGWIKQNFFFLHNYVLSFNGHNSIRKHDNGNYSNMKTTSIDFTTIPAILPADIKTESVDTVSQTTHPRGIKADRFGRKRPNTRP